MKLDRAVIDYAWLVLYSKKNNVPMPKLSSEFDGTTYTVSLHCYFRVHDQILVQGQSAKLANHVYQYAQIDIGALTIAELLHHARQELEYPAIRTVTIAGQPLAPRTT